MRRSLSLAFGMTVALSLAACDQGGGEVLRPVAPDTHAARVAVQGGHCVDLLAGQTILAGSVCTEVVQDTVKITYTATGGWTLQGTHLWVDTTFATLPRNRAGNPQLGLFPYGNTLPAGTTVSTVAIPLSRFGLTAGMEVCAPVTINLVAHAVVSRPKADGSLQTETAYGAGTRLVERGNWATWFSRVLECIKDPPPPPVVNLIDETAFAMKESSLSTCFIGSPLLTTQRWGWSNGPLAEGTYRFDIWAGAGQCDLTKGTKVGTLEFVYAAGTARVSFAMHPGFAMSATHLYVGSQPLPYTIDRRTGALAYTVAPGQYGNQHALTAASSDSYVLTGLSGSVYMVAHAVVSSAP